MSIKMQNDIAVLQMEIATLKRQLAEFIQVADALTATVEVLNSEKAMRDAAVKEPEHGKTVRRGNVGKDKRTSQASV